MKTLEDYEQENELSKQKINTLLDDIFIKIRERALSSKNFVTLDGLNNDDYGTRSILIDRIRNGAMRLGIGHVENEALDAILHIALLWNNVSKFHKV